MRSIRDPLNPPSSATAHVAEQPKSARAAHDVDFAEPPQALPSKQERPAVPPWRRRFDNIASTGLVVGVQVLAFGAIFVRPSRTIVALAVASFFFQTLGITAGYHRLLSHHSFKTSRAIQFGLAWLACAAMQNGPLWWVSWHRVHHRFSDSANDPHSPIARSWWYAHLGWVLDGTHDHADLTNVRDLEVFPELRWLDDWKWVPTLVTGVLCAALGGLPAFVWVFGLATTLAFHGPLCVNSLSHKFGRRDHETSDNSRNNPILGLLILGDGWHNNHHHMAVSARHGMKWWELDVTFYVIKTLEVLRLAWDVRVPKARMVQTDGELGRL